jgi:hypothetical protein
MDTKKIEEEEGFCVPSQPITIDNYIEHQIDLSDKVPNPPFIPVPYPKASRELKSLS